MAYIDDLKKLKSTGEDCSGWIPNFAAPPHDPPGFCSNGAENLPHGAIYLPWALGGINWVSAGNDNAVVSGPFTGCIMVAYAEGESRKVCHVHTGGSADCKEIWTKGVKDKRLTVLCSFKPNDFSMHGVPNSQCYGVITPENDMYAVTVGIFIPKIVTMEPLIGDDSGKLYPREKPGKPVMKIYHISAPIAHTPNSWTVLKS